VTETAVVATESPTHALALYRKHRPAAFDDLVGQSSVVDGLTAALRTGRTVHAYLFSGPRGTGKTSAARILAKCLNCERGGPRPDPCGKCASCVAIAEGTSFDVIEIDAASNSRVEETRELLKGVDVVPAYSRMKVYIVDEVHMMSASAFNALLKTLEEPPAHAVFILATTEPHKVPATILSRCQRYEFRRMAPETIGLRLKEVAAREKIRISADAITRLAFLADGALRDALVLLEQARGFAGEGQIDDAALDRAFGASHRETVSAIVAAIAESDASEALEQVAAAAAAGIDPTWLTRELLRRFRLVLLAQHSPGTLALETPPDDAQAVTALARRLESPRVYAALKHLSAALENRFSTQPRIDLELALVRIIMPGEESGLRDILERLRALESRAEGANGVSASPPAGAEIDRPRAAKTARPASAGSAKTP
jgi:DNA polymerase-3 subunit gamma/tau